LSTGVTVLVLWAVAVGAVLILLAVIWERRKLNRAPGSPPVDSQDLLLRALAVIALVTLVAFFAYLLMDHNLIGIPSFSPGTEPLP
jgi:uncharacterized iron-regulated membrane protein